MNFPASGYGRSSKYFDGDLLFDGTYQIMSATVHSSSEDLTNPVDTKILRAGLLIVPSLTYPGYYVPLSTEDGFLNGTATQFMSQALVLARKEYIDKDFIMGLKRERSIDASHKVVAAYLSCTIFSNKVYYNNMNTVAITDEQWSVCNRIKLVAPGKEVYDPSGETLRALLWKRVETLINPSDI